MGRVLDISIEPNIPALANNDQMRSPLFSPITERTGTRGTRGHSLALLSTDIPP